MIQSFKSRVRYSEVDDHAILTLPGVINYLQDCAVFHGEAAGVGLKWIRENGQTWVLASLRLHMERYPVFDEEIVTTTWASRFRGYLGYRDFTIATADGEILVSGKSDWVYMDMHANKPLSVPQIQLDGYGLHPECALEENYGKRKVRVPAGGEVMEAFPVGERHLDTNGHVNNGQYIEMAQPYLAGGTHPSRIRAEYKKQALLGDLIVPRVCRDGATETVVLESETGEVFFIGEYIYGDAAASQV